jgi:hypothetical protein
MSKTIVDMPKVTQMLDAGWRVVVFKNEMGSYTAEAEHDRTSLARAAQEKVIQAATPDMREVVRAAFDGDNTIQTDDFTPEQALTRLAYKCHGEVIAS